MDGTQDFIPYGADVAPTRKRKRKMDRLTRDALAAEAAGMSYGKWKALHPHTGEDEPAPITNPDVREIVCLNCGGKFIRRHAHSVKYCSDDCRHAYNDRISKARRAAAAEAKE